jgi:hypothetical protein
MAETTKPRFEVKRTHEQSATPETTIGALLDAARLTAIDPRISELYPRETIVPEQPRRFYHEFAAKGGQDTTVEQVMEWFKAHRPIVFIPALPELLYYRAFQTDRRFYRNIVVPLELATWDAQNVRTGHGHPCLYIDGDAFELRLLKARDRWSSSYEFLGVTAEPLVPPR